MSSEDLAARRARHRPVTPRGAWGLEAPKPLCARCGEPWGEHGCDAAALGDELEKEREARQAAEARAAEAEHLAPWRVVDRDRWIRRAHAAEARAERLVAGAAVLTKERDAWRRKAQVAEARAVWLEAERDAASASDAKAQELLRAAEAKLSEHEVAAVELMGDRARCAAALAWIANKTRDPVAQAIVRWALHGEASAYLPAEVTRAERYRAALERIAHEPCRGLWCWNT